MPGQNGPRWFFVIQQNSHSGFVCGQIVLHLYQQWFGENHPILLRGGGLEEWSGDKFDRNLSKRAIDQDQEGQIDQFANNNVYKLLKEDQEGHIHKYTN